MKVLGRTSGGGSIIEFSSQESEILSELQEAIKGSSWSPSPPRGLPIEGNIEKAFIVILQFVEAKFAVNRIHQLANELDEAIGFKNDL